MHIQNVIRLILHNNNQYTSFLCMGFIAQWDINVHTVGRERRYRQNFFHRGSRKIYRGLWSLILVTYAPLCYTCMTLLHCPILADVNGEDDVMVRHCEGVKKGGREGG